MFTALGISLITKSGLGTSPVTSFAYVLTFIFPEVSLGVFAFLVNATVFLAEALLLGREFRPLQFLQLPATFVFSSCIDLWMWLFRSWAPGSYPAEWVLLLVGCAVLGLGVALQVTAGVLTLPCEGFVKVLSHKFRWNFGVVKTVFDVSMVTAAVVLSFACLHGLFGVREGTVAAALTVGFFSRSFQKRLVHLPEGRKAAKKAEHEEINKAAA